MLSSCILTFALCASAAAAVPSPHERYTSRPARRPASGLPHRPRPSIVNGTDVSYSSNWAGAVLNDAPNTWTSVTGTFTVPAPRAPAGGSGSYAAAVWVGIDGDSCQTAILQTGINMGIDDDGAPYYTAWWEWWPDYQRAFAGAFDVAPGDEVTALVVATSATSGFASLVNVRTNATVSQTIKSTASLCMQDAEWIVEDFGEAGQLVPFADFGTVTFSAATAGGVSGLTGPAGAKTYDIEQDGTVVTDVSVGWDSVVVSYVGS